MGACASKRSGEKHTEKEKKKNEFLAPPGEDVLTHIATFAGSGDNAAWAWGRNFVQAESEGRGESLPTSPAEGSSQRRERGPSGVDLDILPSSPRPEDGGEENFFLGKEKNCSTSSTSSFVCCGSDGGCYLYDCAELLAEDFLNPTSNSCGLRLKPKVQWKASGRAVNRAFFFRDRGFLTCAADGCVALWDGIGRKQREVARHGMSCMAVDFAFNKVVSGGRDCVVKLSDAETGETLASKKILRNVVTSVKAVPARNCYVQCSEDLQLRIYDSSLVIAAACAAGPNQIVACDVIGDDVICGTKGFSEENVEVIIYDLRKQEIRERRSRVCAQSIDHLVAGGPRICPKEDPQAPDAENRKPPRKPFTLVSRDGTLQVWDADDLKKGVVVENTAFAGCTPLTSVAVAGGPHAASAASGVCFTTALGPRITAFDLNRLGAPSICDTDGATMG